MATRSRHQPCDILRAQGIPFLLWFEDALAVYGVPTALFDLHLLATPGPTTTVLLSAADWGICNLENTRPSSPDGFVPPLAALVDGLVESLLDLPLAPASEALQSHLDFAEDLKVEHRQFHYDALSKPGLGTNPFIQEQRQIRDEIKEGGRQPQRNSWYLPPSRSVSLAALPSQASPCSSRVPQPSRWESHPAQDGTLNERRA
ncbi:hypothetical protein C8A01DRAFT_47963 [Parachaetomium inaequale]|uniref:Uncharacterized protein n=1 Tax=Parachaetomium inaequale TaxID=2588326 RepID=A0AAN6SQC8_9PEZI|nr:hypothetical protein C8A01DRAFT_47963 [Parachaetomium inaequale]